MFMHRRNAEVKTKRTNVAITLKSGTMIVRDNVFYVLDKVYTCSGVGIYYEFKNEHRGRVVIHTELSGRVVVQHFDFDKAHCEELGELSKYGTYGKRELVVEQGMLCVVVCEDVSEYKDKVSVGDVLEYHSRDGVKSLAVLMIGKDGALICENQKGETVTVRKNELTVANNYDIVWVE